MFKIHTLVLTPLLALGGIVVSIENFRNYFAHPMYKDYHLQQTDWRRYGVILSILFSVGMWVFFLLVHLIVLFKGFQAIWPFLEKIFRFYKEAVEALMAN